LNLAEDLAVQHFSPATRSADAISNRCSRRSSLAGTPSLARSDPKDLNNAVACQWHATNRTHGLPMRPGVAHGVVMSGHRIVPVVRKLSVKPGMQ